MKKWVAIIKEKFHQQFLIVQPHGMYKLYRNIWINHKIYKYKMADKGMAGVLRNTLYNFYTNLFYEPVLLDCLF